MASNRLEFLDREDTYATALMLLYACTDNPKYATLSELPYILDHDNFMNFIRYYEGQTITIPSYSAISDALRTLLLFKFYIVDKQPWKDALYLSGFVDDGKISAAKRRLNKFIEYIDEYNCRLGGLIGKEDRREIPDDTEES